MTPLNIVIQLANDGARLLRIGHTQDALFVLRQAMTVLKECSFHSQMSFERETTLFSDEQCLPNDPVDGAVYMYQRPLMLPTHFDCADIDEGVGIVTAYLLFNLALACHFHGLDSGTSAPFQRAQHIYQTMLESLPAFLPSDTDSVCGGIVTQSLMQCLILNNLGHLHYEQCDYDSSESCLARLEQVMVATDCLATLDRHIMDEMVAEEIKLNLAIVQTPSAAHAA